MLNNLVLDNQPRNYLIISSDLQSRYAIVIKKICEFVGEDEKKILNNPDIRYVSLPIIDKSGNISSSISNNELILKNYNFLDEIDSKRIGNEITIDQIREIISFTQLSAHKSKKFIIINEASSMNKESSSALLKTLEEVSSNCSFFLLSGSINRIHETIRSRCQIFHHELSLKINNTFTFKDIFFEKHSFLKNINQDFDISNLVDIILEQINGLLNKSLDPIEVSNEWHKSHVNLILCIISEYIIFCVKSDLSSNLKKTGDLELIKLCNIYDMIPSIKKNITLNINVKYLLNNLTIELAA